MSEFIYWVRHDGKAITGCVSESGAFAVVAAKGGTAMRVDACLNDRGERYTYQYDGDCWVRA